MRLWPRKYIQPDYTAALNRRVQEDCGLGDAAALGLFLFVGMLALGWTSVGSHDAGREKARPGKLAYSTETRAKAFVRMEPTTKRRVRPARLAMAQRHSP